MSKYGTMQIIFTFVGGHKDAITVELTAKVNDMGTYIDEFNTLASRDVISYKTIENRMYTVISKNILSIEHVLPNDK